MQKTQIILAIETSCDDTCVCIYDSNSDRILSNLISRHICKNGIIPEKVARSHTEALPKMIELALKEAKILLTDVSVVAATYGPGLTGSLVTGLTYAKTLAWALGKSFFAANHIEGHILSVKHSANLDFPYGCLVLSGGHTLLCVAEELGRYKIIGLSVDDAAGECFDKVAREIGLEQPGGPAIEKLAKTSNACIKLPNALKNSFNFSFSGIKTAARRAFNGNNAGEVAASLLNTIAESICEKIKKFCKEIVPNYTRKDFPIGIVGGVAANRLIYQSVSSITDKYSCKLFTPPIEFCTDNAFMIAFQTSLYMAKSSFSSLSKSPESKISIRNEKKSMFYT